ncbi:MAG: phosphotransferase, partial [Actinobacteria bacterium]|nr:phosphotransferase [Actinomycetota bacterium]
MSRSSGGAAEAVPDLGIVTRLLREQAPHLGDLPVREIGVSGSSNWVFRVGDALAIRLPRSDDYVADLASEVRWLPGLAPHLPVPVPDVVAVGRPSDAFPRPWSIVSWVPGESPLGLDVVQ